MDRTKDRTKKIFSWLIEIDEEEYDDEEEKEENDDDDG